MKFRIKYAQQVVGLFVLVAAVAVVGVIAAMGANQRWFAPRYAFFTVFSSTRGVSVGNPISYRGFTIGEVTGIGLAGGDNVRVDFVIEDSFYDRVVPNSIIELSQSPIGGSRLVFHRGSVDTAPLAEGSFIPARQSTEGQIVEKGGLARIPPDDDAISGLLVQVGNVLASVNDTLVFVNAGLAGDQARPLGQLLANTNSVLAGVDDTIGDVDGYLADLMPSINGMADSIEAELADPQGLIVDLIGAEGSIATFLDDDNVIFNQIDTALTQVNTILAEIESLTAFVNTTQPQLAAILNEGQEALRTSQDVLEGLSNNPLIRGGITPAATQPTTFESVRDAEF